MNARTVALVVAELLLFTLLVLAWTAARSYALPVEGIAPNLLP